MKVKICGMTDRADIEAVNAAEPEYAGFVFASGKRQIEYEKAYLLRSLLKKEIQTVGVFVNNQNEDIIRLCKDKVIDLIQLHGEESLEAIDYLKTRTGKPVIKAVRVESREQILQAEKLPCDYLLLDSGQKNSYGGTGVRFDWSLIPDLTKPFILAGGLKLEALSELEMIFGKSVRQRENIPFCLDISSGVETGGKKDAVKISEFVRAVRKEFS